jgi:hypothetical protein
MLRNCLLKHAIEGKVEDTGIRGRERKQLVDDLKETKEFWILKGLALDRTVWRIRCGRGYRPVVRQAA